MTLNDPKLHPKLTALMDAYNAHQDQEAIRLARSLLNDPEENVRIEAKRILASCLFDTKAYEEASSLWVSLFEDSDDPNDWVSVVTSLVAAKKWDEADRFFEPALNKLNEFAKRVTQEGTGWFPGMQTGAHLLHYYAHAATDAGASERALPKIRDLSKLYATMGITDDHMLITRGVLPFQDFCKLVEKVYPHTRQDPVWSDIFNELLSKIDDDGKSMIQKVRQSLRSHHEI